VDNQDINKELPLGAIHCYWREFCNGSEFNDPKLYLNAPPQRWILLRFFINRFFPDKDIKILEIGSSVGRNLDLLLKDGFNNLTGVEINPISIEYMEKYFPELNEKITIYQSSIENCIKLFSDNQFDLVFTMAVLEHIHPDSEWIFKEIARITKGLITIEDEKNTNQRVFKRNYFDIFSKFGMEQKVECNLEDLKDDDFYGFMCRVFIK